MRLASTFGMARGGEHGRVGGVLDSGGFAASSVVFAGASREDTRNKLHPELQGT